LRERTFQRPLVALHQVEGFWRAHGHAGVDVAAWSASSLTRCVPVPADRADLKRELPAWTWRTTSKATCDVDLVDRRRGGVDGLGPGDNRSGGQPPSGGGRGRDGLGGNIMPPRGRAQ
jgi:hypothetical protein